MWKYTGGIRNKVAEGGYRSYRKSVCCRRVQVVKEV